MLVNTNLIGDEAVIDLDQPQSQGCLSTSSEIYQDNDCKTETGAHQSNKKSYPYDAIKKSVKKPGDDSSFRELLLKRKLSATAAVTLPDDI